MIIYKIQNNINNKCYIGKTIFDSIWERYHCNKNHKDIIKRHHNKQLKYDFENIIKSFGDDEFIILGFDGFTR